METSRKLSVDNEISSIFHFPPTYLPVYQVSKWILLETLKRTWVNAAHWQSGSPAEHFPVPTRPWVNSQHHKNKENNKTEEVKTKKKKSKAAKSVSSSVLCLAFLKHTPWSDMRFIFRLEENSLSSTLFFTPWVKACPEALLWQLQNFTDFRRN